MNEDQKGVQMRDLLIPKIRMVSADDIQSCD